MPRSSVTSMRTTKDPSQALSMHMRMGAASKLLSVPRGERANDRYYDENLAVNARARLRSLCDEKGGQTKAGESLHCNQSTIARALSGQPSARVLIALADYYKTSVDDILGRAPASPPPAGGYEPADLAREIARHLGAVRK